MFKSAQVEHLKKQQHPSVSKALAELLGLVEGVR